MEQTYDDQTWIKRGDQFLRIGQYQEAIDNYDHIQSTHPEYKHVLFQKGQAYRSMHRNRDAIECYDKLLATDPDNIEVLFYKGLDQNCVRRSENTIGCLDRVLELHDDKKPILSPRTISIALWYKGEALYYSGRSREAIEYIDRALVNAGKVSGHKMLEFKKFVVDQIENPETDETATADTKKWYNKISFRWPISVS